MALSYWFEGIENHKEVCYDDTGTIRPMTELLIFTTMHVGLGEITEKNADEFYARMVIIHKLHDIGIMHEDGVKLLDPEHVKLHIGLRTNVSNETRAQWVKRNFTDKTTGIISEHQRNHRRKMSKEKASV